MSSKFWHSLARVVWVSRILPDRRDRRTDRNNLPAIRGARSNDL